LKKKNKKPTKSDAAQLSDEIRQAYASESIPDQYAPVIEQIAQDMENPKNNTNEFFQEKYGINLALAKVASMVHKRFNKALVLASEKIEHEQTDRVLAMSVQGLSIRQIAQQTGLTHDAVSRHMSKAGLDLHPRDPAYIRRAINLEIARIDMLYGNYFKAAQAGDTTAAALCLRFSERRSRLLGLDSPSVHAILMHKVDGPTDFDLSKLSDEELATWIKLQQKSSTEIADAEIIDMKVED
jgi:DNA-binding CsgD family transcriptional regulator